MMRNFLKMIVALGMGAICISSLANPAEAVVLWDENVDPDLSDFRKDDAENGFLGGPTQLDPLMPGENLVTIILDNPRDPNASRSLRDLDYFTITVEPGQVLSNIFLTNYLLGDDVAFISMQAGTEIDQPPSPPAPPPDINDPNRFPDPTQLLGYGLVGLKQTYSNDPGCQALGIVGSPLAPGTVVQPGEDLLPVLGAQRIAPDGIAATGRLQPNNCADVPPPIGFTSPLGAGQYTFWIQQTTFLPEDGPPNVQFTLNFVASKVPEPTSTLGLMAFGILGIRWANRNR